MNSFFGKACAVAAMSLAVTTSAWAVTAGTSDDFQATTGNWVIAGGGAAVAPVQPSLVAGALQITSLGTAVQNGKMLVKNLTQWTGDYSAATGLGSEVIVQMDLDSGATALTMRVALISAGSAYVTATAAAFTTNTTVGMQTATFTFNAADMADLTAGAMTLQQVLANVTEFRLLSAATETIIGDQVAATLRVDNIQIIQVPVELQEFSVD